MVFSLLHFSTIEAILKAAETNNPDDWAMVKTSMEKHPPLEPLVPYSQEEVSEVLGALKEGGVTIVEISSNGTQPVVPPHSKRRKKMPGLDS
ncbi:MAG: hypothetical protein WAO98_06255 [Alphaproteobacteria bacterium]